MHKVTPKFPKMRTILPIKLLSSPLFFTLGHCPQPFRRCRRGCQAHRPSQPPAARHHFLPHDAVRCIGHRSALHRSSQRAAWALAAHCLSHLSIMPASSPSPPGGSLPRQPAPTRMPMMPCEAASAARGSHTRRFPKHKGNAPPSCSHRRRGIITTVVLLIHYH